MGQGVDDENGLRLDPEVIDEIYARLAGRLMNDMRAMGGARDRSEGWKSDPEDYVPAEDGGQVHTGSLPGMPEFEFDRDASADLLRVLAQAQLSWLTRGFRYWGQVAEIQQGLMSSAVESMAAMANGDAGDELRPALEDQVTGYLRQLSDLSSREARLLQVELEKLASSVRDTLGDDRTMEEPRRWARAKP